MPRHARSETQLFRTTLRNLRTVMGWNQGTLGRRLSVSKGTIGHWECGHWLPPLTQRVHIVAALHEAPPAHVRQIAVALGVSSNEGAAPLLDAIDVALDKEDEDLAQPPTPPRPSPVAVRAAVDAVVQGTADALDVRANDLRRAVAKILTACAEVGADLGEARGAVTVEAKEKEKRC